MFGLFEALGGEEEPLCLRPVESSVLQETFEVLPSEASRSASSRGPQYQHLLAQAQTVAVTKQAVRPCVFWAISGWAVGSRSKVGRQVCEVGPLLSTSVNS